MAETNIQSAENEALYLSKTEDVLEKYKHGRGSLIPILQTIQTAYGYLPEKVVDFVSERLNISVNEIIGVATFYAQFHMRPRGRHIIKACSGTACHVKGAKQIIEKLGKKLDIPVGETTKDTMFTLEEVACLGACSLAPVIMVDEDVYGQLLHNTVGNIIDEIKG
ncbi:pyruvate:ferredoxin (flavodoxin) oxidoreductase [Candidatus Kuenenia stuttgartiensis]|uniref:Pyruvate:ferredoxin (Flavodoxin) oxidoreductase n=1 Tax=Kuenenia stuttgartiensis TaxID=174633 RepID=Q1PWG7_KUEST|nr:NADH-quinone oxidoreductase subunit NuoE [Candidatus Kuenenia stuttgartiensis]MCF6152194.1 NADH-quinone oxidoreductase subunit NuoE [Candidatus Kuenenia stuttgartiensis]QII13946.1 pyruvate:ferredoxin (flavodoxin) oxidoreductase [Candidatus Kuenenia stuttgartiensis]CAJ71571.1 similar to to proton-translocating NADH dehydrogenase I, 24 kDa subunit (NuoE) [Candidatus Kuenenia stuttgartiensis]